MKPAAYVQRAYLHGREHGGRLPPWARKTGKGHWLFDPEYIRADAADNLKTISVGEAARLAGATRRTIQNWIDSGNVTILGGAHVKGRDRRILKDPFLAKLDKLKRRLETPPVIGQKLRQGKAVPEEVLQRVSALKPESKLQAAKILSAAAVEAQLAAAAAVSRAASAGAGESARRGPPVKQRAEMIERRFSAARRAQAGRAAIEQYACEVAERLVNDVFDDRITRIDALMLFNRIAEQRGVPRDIRIRVRKRFFGK